jgi:hypothetical protein
MKMSAAVTRTDRVAHDTNEFTQRAESSVPVKLEAQPVVEDHGMTPLMRAASDGSAGTVQALLDRGAEVNAKRTDGFNALALAAFFGHSQVVWLLLENGADLAATGRFETLPEMWADIRGFLDIGDTIREARELKQVEAPNPRTTVLAEPARFPRPADQEHFQAAGVPESGEEVSVTEALDRETPSVISRTVVQESESSVIDAASETSPAILPEPVDEDSQPSVIVAAAEPTLAIIPEPADDESQPSVIHSASDSEATLVRPRAPADDESQPSVIVAAVEPTLTIMPEPADEESQPSVIHAASDPEATLVRPSASVNEESQASRIDTASDPEITFLTTDAPFSQETIARRVEPLADIFPPDQPEQGQEQPISKPPVRVLKTLPEIEDPPPLEVPEFRPGSVFVSRITSSRKNLVALVLVVWLASTCIAYFLIPQIRKAFADGRTEAATKTNSLPAASSNAIAGSETGVSGSVETPAAATTESTNAPASNEIKEDAADSTTDTTANTTNVESTSRVDSVEVSESSAVNAVARGSESRAHSTSLTSAGNSVPEARENKRAFTEVTSMSRFAAPARKQRAVSRAAKLKQPTAAEEQPKPAPLSVEVSRTRSVLAAPARSASEVPVSQPPPLSIISGKPKSKVIQWP